MVFFLDFHDGIKSVGVYFLLDQNRRHSFLASPPIFIISKLLGNIHPLFKSSILFFSSQNQPFFWGKILLPNSFFLPIKLSLNSLAYNDFGHRYNLIACSWKLLRKCWRSSKILSLSKECPFAALSNCTIPMKTSQSFLK